MILVLLTLSCCNGFVNSPLSLNGRTLVPYGGVRRVTDPVRGHGMRLSMLHTPSMGEVDHGTLFAQLIGEKLMCICVLNGGVVVGWYCDCSRSWCDESIWSRLCAQFWT